MEYKNISALRINLYECAPKKAPRDYIKPIEPENAIATTWIPQTMGDQIWVMWKFKTAEERKTFENNLPADVSRWIDRKLINTALRYGWHIRDENGFYN